MNENKIVPPNPSISAFLEEIKDDFLLSLWSSASDDYEAAIAKEIIPKQDLDKISAYVFGEPTPISLRFRIWLLIAIQFISRGLEFHEQLKTDSFEFHVDENKQEYVALSHETKQKNWQGGIDANENPKEKRMYAVPSAGAKCPVASLKLYLSKLDPKATFLFNRCSKEALKSPTTEEIWYTDVPIKKIPIHSVHGRHL